YSSIRIEQINFADARKFILQYEWLGNLGSAKYCFGLYIDQHLAAVVCFTDHVSPQAYKGLLEINNEKKILQLNRGASAYWAPKWAPSKLISKALKIISKEKNILAVFAYADPEAGEIGTIYQACNALYIGKTDPGGAKTYIINGKQYHPRKVHKLYGTRKREELLKIDSKYKTLEIRPKYRYVFLTGTKQENLLLKEKLSKHIQEYPKRKIHQH
ncbi:MAG TPA: hypothetical protein VHO28_11590, partial [Ignavibacteriales bacterium]|nr:hypothetical protein [Ignavibacteriales bacterium]